MIALNLSTARRRKPIVILTGLARALFSAKVSTVVAVVCLAAMWWHNVAIDNTIEAQEAVGLDCLLTMPWDIVWAFRAARMPMPEEGGEL